MLLHAVGLALVVSMGAAEKPRMLVLDIQGAGGVPADVAGALSEAVVQEVAARGFFDVLSSREMQTLLGLERQRQMAGCSTDGTSCLAELAGALGARFVLSGTVARLGEAYQLTLQTLDSSKAQPLGRSVRLARDLATLREGLPWAVAEATATPLPPPPSRVLPYSLIGAGGAVLVGAGLLGQDALARERVVNEELALGARQPGVLRSLSDYEGAARSIGQQKTLTFAGLLGGAGLVAAGILLMPRETAQAGGGAPALSLVPTGTGAALVGVLP
jgi:TolB-like protein